MHRYILLLAVLPAMAQTPVDTALGQRIFESQCALCHGQDGGGGRGPNLRRPSLIHAPDDKALRSAIQNGIPPEMPGAWQLDPKEVGSVAAYVRTLGAVPAESLPGDAARGRAIYDRSGCAGCHILAGEGHGYGPGLTGIASRRSAAFLRKTLLDPASSLPEGFLELSVNGQSCLLVTHSLSSAATVPVRSTVSGSPTPARFRSYPDRPRCPHSAISSRRPNSTT
jgi:putative heme-binding domain-containing protein